MNSPPPTLWRGNPAAHRGHPETRNVTIPSALKPCTLPQGLRERAIWLGEGLEGDAYYKELVGAGVDKALIQRLCANEVRPNPKPDTLGAAIGSPHAPERPP